MEHPVNMKGVVSNMEWTNPHVFIFLDVKDDNGSVEEWRVEGNSPNMLFRAGWKKRNDQGGRPVDGEWRTRQERIKNHAAHHPHAGEWPKVRRAGIQVISIGHGNWSGVHGAESIPSFRSSRRRLLPCRSLFSLRQRRTRDPQKRGLSPAAPDFSGVWFIDEYHRNMLPNEDPPFQPWAEALFKERHVSKTRTANPIPGRTRRSDAYRPAYRGPCSSRFRGRSCRRATG